jgi:hypothetical protein
VEVTEESPELTQESMLQTVFRRPAAPAAPTDLGPPASAAAPAEAPEASAAQSMMTQMTTAMLNSMRGTYAILARRMELFRGIGPEHVARIFSQGHTLEFTPGQIIFEKGAPGDKMFAILIGEVAIFDEERQLAVLGRGDMFGEMALLSQEPRSASAQALVNTSLLSLDRDSIQRSLPAEVSIALLTNVIVTLGERIRLANQLIHELRRG